MKYGADVSLPDLPHMIGTNCPRRRTKAVSIDRRHQIGFLAVLPNEDRGGAVDVEVGGHAEPESDYLFVAR